VHGLTTEFLRDKPKFHEIAEELRDYVQGAEVIIHNAPFDLGFLNHEFERSACRLSSALQRRDRHPGQRQGTASRQAQLAGRAVRPLRRLERAPQAARRAARLGAAGRRLPGDDARPEQLSMDVEIEDRRRRLLEAGAAGEIIVLAASADELAEHDAVLAGLDKASKGNVFGENYSPQG
jgi:DNA polymerase-3 subunit epsilon